MNKKFNWHIYVWKLDEYNFGENYWDYQAYFWSQVTSDLQKSENFIKLFMSLNFLSPKLYRKKSAQVRS
jgi:hypothetical protein